MKTDNLTENTDLFFPSRKKKKEYKNLALSGPLSSSCNVPGNIGLYLYRKLLSYRKVLPVRFANYLTSHEYPVTISDLLKLDTKKLLKFKNIGSLTVKELIRFLNNIHNLDHEYDGGNNPILLGGTIIRSCFNNPDKLFAEWKDVEISIFQNYLPARFFHYLQLHPELATINDLLNMKTDRLINEKSLGKITLLQLLRFLKNLPVFNPVRENHRSDISKARSLIQEDELLCCYDILDIYFRIITEFCELLSEKEKLVLQKKFVLGKTLVEIAAEFHLSRERVRQIIGRRIAMLKQPLSLFETRFKANVVQMLSESNGFIDERLLPPDTGSILFVNLLSYIYPALPTKANRLTHQTIWGDKYLSGIYRRLRGQKIASYQYTFRSLCSSMGITDPDDAMNLYRIILGVNGFDFDVKEGVVYVVRGRLAGRMGEEDSISFKF